MQEVLRESNDSPPQITVRKLTQINNDYISLLMDLKRRGEDKFLIDCGIKTIKPFLHAVSWFAILSVYHNECLGMKVSVNVINKTNVSIDDINTMNVSTNVIKARRGNN